MCMAKTMAGKCAAKTMAGLRTCVLSDEEHMQSRGCDMDGKLRYVNDRTAQDVIEKRCKQTISHEFVRVPLVPLGRS